jgi:hypothetical protein
LQNYQIIDEASDVFHVFEGQPGAAGVRHPSSEAIQKLGNLLGSIFRTFLSGKLQENSAEILTPQKM